MENLVRDVASVQDRDLLGRLTTYFQHVEARIREGQGWLIFNADRQRAGRITRFIGERLREYRPLLSSYTLQWRDFALNAYMLKVELAPGRLAPPPDGAEGADPRVLQEYTIAGRVSRDIYYQMRYCDLLVLSGVAPVHPHEVTLLDEVVEGRVLQRLPSILISPRMPQQLEAEFRTMWPDKMSGFDPWQRFFGRLYDSSLIAF